jgi:hypothetical protein
MVGRSHRLRSWRLAPFTEPVELGRLSWLAEKLIKHHLAFILGGALAAGAGAAATCWSFAKSIA